MFIFEVHVFAVLVNEYVDFEDAIDLQVSIVLIVVDPVRILDDFVLDIEDVILQVLFIKFPVV